MGPNGKGTQHKGGVVSHSVLAKKEARMLNINNWTKERWAAGDKALHRSMYTNIHTYTSMYMYSRVHSTVYLELNAFAKSMMSTSVVMSSVE